MSFSMSTGFQNEGLALVLSDSAFGCPGPGDQPLVELVDAVDYLHNKVGPLWANPGQGLQFPGAGCEDFAD